MNTGSALAQFTITLSQAVTEPVQVDWFTSDGTAKAGVDYAANKGTVIFSPGQTEKTVDILVYGRAVGAEDRSFFVEMLPPTNAILGASIGECIITVDTSGSIPVTQIIVPTGPQGIQGKSAYQSYLDTTTDNPPMTEAEWVESLKGDPAEIAQEVAPLIDVGETVLTAEGTETLSKPDSTTVKVIARRVAYAAQSKIATVLLADGDNLLSASNLTGDRINFNAAGFVPKVLHAGAFIDPEWSVSVAGKLTVYGATAGDVLYAIQYELSTTSQLERSQYNKHASFENGSSAIRTITDALLWEGAPAGQGPYYVWTGSLPKQVPQGSTPENSGGVGIGGWKDVGDATTRSDLSKNTGAGLIGYDQSQSYPENTVGDALKKFVPVLNLALFTSLRAAIESLPSSGGKIVVPSGSFESGDWTYNNNYMSKPNVTIVGEKMPTWNNDLSALTGGSIIKGRFNAWAHNFNIENIGFDMGKAYCDVKFPGADFSTASHPLGGTWDAFAFASPNDGSGPRRNVRIKNVIGLLYNSATVGHAVLMEGISEGSAENTVAIYGVHGNVIKAIQFHAKNLTSYGQMTNGTIIKSDTYALCGDVVVDGTHHAKQPIDTTPWSNPVKTDNAVCINAGTAAFTGSIMVSNTIASDCANHIRPQGSIPISDIVITGQKSERCDWPVLVDTSTNCLRMIVDDAIWSNCTQGAFVGQAQAWPGQSQLTLKSVKATNITNAIFYAMSNGLIVVDEVEAYNVKYLYSWQNGGKIYVGREKVAQLNGGNKFDPAGIAPVLGGGWSNYDSTNSQYDLKLEDYKVRVSGLMKTVGSNPTVVYLPDAIKPALPIRLPCIQYDAAGIHAGFLTISSGIQVGNNSLPAGLQFLSLDGVEWNY